MQNIFFLVVLFIEFIMKYSLTNFIDVTDDLRKKEIILVSPNILICNML